MNSSPHPQYQRRSPKTPARTGPRLAGSLGPVAPGPAAASLNSVLPAQGDDWLSQLLQVLRRQGELCTRLKVDFELADDLTNDAQKSATLLGSLRRRQRFVDEIMRLDRNMEALRHRWREEQQQVPADAREEIEAVATMVRDALDAVSEADGQLIAELKSARERVRADLALITSGRSAHKGYRGGGTHLGSQALSGNALPSNRYLDGCA